MPPRRGFPTEANWIASDVRAELGLEPEDRLDPLTLADALDIPVTRMSELRREAPRVVAYFGGPQQGAFSAMTLFCGRRRTIIHNDAHSPARQVSNITHELSHGLLLHPRTPPLDAVGLRASDRAPGGGGWLARRRLAHLGIQRAAHRRAWLERGDRGDALWRQPADGPVPAERDRRAAARHSTRPPPQSASVLAANLPPVYRAVPFELCFRLGVTTPAATSASLSWRDLSAAATSGAARNFSASASTTGPISSCAERSRRT